MPASVSTESPRQFSRYECKYLVTERQAASVRSHIAPYLESDPFAARRPDGKYEVSSLYLDSDGLRLCHETLEGLRDRFKLRVRAYSDRPGDPVFFEIKKRRDGRIEKVRARVRRSDMLRLLQTGELNTDTMPFEEATHLRSFLTRMQAIDARPRILVRYEREAYRCKFESDVRVTFDRQLRGLSSNHLPVLGTGIFFERTGWTVVEGARIILELKFNDRYPPWMGDVIKSAGLTRISYSKYARAIAASTRSGTRRAHAP